jgi:hypothetical protein
LRLDLRRGLRIPAQEKAGRLGPARIQWSKTEGGACSGRACERAFDRVAVDVGRVHFQFDSKKRLGFVPCGGALRINATRVPSKPEATTTVATRNRVMLGNAPAA